VTSLPEPAPTLAAIDVGTNSVHLVVARLLDGGGFEVVEREKEPVRLGSGPGDMKQLGADAMDRGIAALGRMRQVAAISGAPVRAVATSAVREAENRDEFVRRAREEAGVDVEVISGIEEARLIHLGVLQALPVFDTPLLVVDIGGGSTELVLGYRGEVRASRSLKLGHLRLTDRFFTGERLRSRDVMAARSFVRSALVPFVHEVEHHGFKVAAGSSGTIQALARLVQPDLRVTNAFTFTRDQLATVIDALLIADTAAKRREIEGIEPGRADVIVAGALILEQVMDAFGAQSLMVSDYALREGVLLDTVGRTEGGRVLHHLRDVSRRGVAQLAALCDEEPEHSAQVARLALSLFDATTSLHQLDEGCREYLEAAALLANVGLFVSHSKHHLHSYYVIRNSERLVGLTDTEIEIIALVARYHRKSGPKDSHPEFTRLAPRERHIVRVLAGLLRVAIGLDRTHEGKITSVRVVALDPLQIEAVGVPGADIGLELYAAKERSGLLGDVFEREVEIIQA
jgi:exopolyphosphatase/guanosine-5'-triphosphate,3'-diphosphate pyrophosphatase